VKTYRLRDLCVGLREQFTVTVSAEDMELFAQFSGDVNPLHMDEIYAKDAGFVGRVVYGLLTSSFYSTLAGVFLPGRYCILHGINVEFSEPVYIGDTLTVSGEVRHVNEAYKRVELRANITNQNDEVISKAKIKAGVLDGE
jgi:acyl dehydratase